MKTISYSFFLFNPLKFFTNRLFVMFFFFCFSGIACPYVFHAQNEKVVIPSASEMSVEEVFSVLGKQTGHSFVYPANFFSEIPTIQIPEGSFHTRELLDKTLADTNISYEFSTGKSIIFKKKFSKALAQEAPQIQIQGNVVDANGQPLPGANIIEKGTTNGTQTDLDGNFSLVLTDADAVLVISYIGFNTQEIPIGDQTDLAIQLTEDLEGLEEVVVQAYATTSERLNTQQLETVTNDSFQNFPVASPQEALQGQASGVQINNSTGVLGAPQVIRIRGVTSFSIGTTPLFVIDGVPLNDGSGVAGQYSSGSGATALNPLIDLNPNDIESLTVLKDAAATSLYGSRGANGVILITTKKGQASDQARFTFDYYTGRNEPTVKPEMLSFDQWVGLRKALGDPREFSGEGFNWDDVTLRTGKMSSYSLSVAGGNSSTTYFLGGTYATNESYLIGNDLDKLNGRLNLTSKATPKTRLGLNLALSSLKTTRIPTETAITSSWLIRQGNTPNTSPYDAEGNPVPVGWGNPVLINQERLSQFRSRRVTGNAYVEYEILKELKFKSDWGLDMINTDTRNRSNEILTEGGSASKSIVSDVKWLTTNTLGYVKNFEEHRFTLLLGQSFETSRREDTSAGRRGFISDDLLNVSSGSELTSAGSSRNQWALSSLFSRLNYNYKNRYILEGNYRRDGSSRFGENNRYGNFGAFSAAWLMSEESFFPETNWISFLKFGLSYGTSGNDRVGNHASRGLYALARYIDQSGLYYSQPGNPSLTWETTSQWDTSVNAYFFENRLKLDLSLWRKVTDGILIDVPLPYKTGFSSRKQNIGEMLNRGLDLTLGGDIIQNESFRWSTSLNVGFLKNEVTHLPDSSPKDENGNRFVSLTSFTNVGVRAIEGRSSQEFYLPQYLGIDSETGHALWRGADGAPTSNYNEAPRAYVGSAIPDATGGFSNTFSYKNLSLRVFFNFVKGGHVYLQDHNWVENPLFSVGANQKTTVLDYWTPDNRDAYAPALNSPTLPIWAAESTKALYDAGFVRLKNITLAYDFPKALTQNIGVFDSVRIYLLGQNLWTFNNEMFDRVGVDPEVNTSANVAGNAQGLSFFTSSPNRQITLGVNLGF